MRALPTHACCSLSLAALVALCAGAGACAAAEPDAPTPNAGEAGKGGGAAGSGGAVLGTGGMAATGGGDGSGGVRAQGSGGAATTDDAGAAKDGGLRADAAADGATALDDAGAGAGCAGALLCDSFETGEGAALDAALWQVAAANCSGTGHVDVDATVAHGGSRSARVRGGGGYCNHVFIAPASLPEPLPDPLFGRFFVRFSAALDPAHVTFVALHDASEDKDLRMGGQSEILMWNRESDDATLPELSPTGIAGSIRPAVDTWVCVEFELSGARGELRTWVDGMPVPGLMVEGDPTPDVDSQWKRKTDWHPRPSDARFGWESYGDRANTLWFDDIALGNKRLRCSP